MMSLNRLLPILWARRAMLLIVFGITVGTTLVVSVLMPKAYVAESMLVVDSRAADPLTGSTIPFLQTAEYLATQVDVIESHNVAAKVVDELKLAEAPESIEAFRESTDGRGSIRDWLADRLIRHLEVTPSRNSSVVSVGYASADPQFAAAAANAFANAFLATNLELKTEPFKRQAAWYQDQLQSLRRTLESAQVRLADYQRQQNIVGGNDHLDVENARLSEVSSQLVTAQLDLFNAQSRQKQVDQAVTSGRTPELADILGNNLLETLIADLGRAEAKFAEIAQRYDTNHPQYQGSAAEVASLQQRFTTEVQNAIGSVRHTSQIAAQRVNDLQAALEQQKQRILQLKAPQNEYDVLQRDVEIAQRSYDAALQRASDVRLASQLDQSSISVLNAAVAPLEPARPKLVLNLLLAVFFGGLLAVATALTSELFDRRVRSAADLTENFEIVVLAELPQLVRLQTAHA